MTMRADEKEIISSILSKSSLKQSSIQYLIEILNFPKYYELIQNLDKTTIICYYYSRPNKRKEAKDINNSFGVNLNWPDLDSQIKNKRIKGGTAVQKHGSTLTRGRLKKKEKKSAREPIIPKDNEWFELVVDYDEDPMNVVRDTDFFARTGYPVDDCEWDYLNPKLVGGRETLRVKLIQLGYVSDLTQAREKAEALGYDLVGGEARRPLVKKFPKPSGTGRMIVFGGSEWRSPSGRLLVACLEGIRDEWRFTFRESRGCYCPFPRYWRWVVLKRKEILKRKEVKNK